MTFSAGDRVKFLNAKGGGVISRIIDPRMVSVTVEGGFEIPTLISELVKIDEKNPAARFFLEKTGFTAGNKEDTTPDADPVEEDDRQSALPETVLSGRKSQDLCLAFFPHDQKWLISGLLDVYLVNNTDFDVLYNLFLEKPSGMFTGKDYGSLFPGTKLLIATISREEITEWISGSIQFLFHAGTIREVLPPFNSQFRIAGQKFYQESSYRENAMLEGKCFLVKIVSVSETLKKLSSKVVADQKRSGDQGDDNLIRIHLKGRREAEVDLHIHELIEDPAEVEQTDVLQFQKDYFVRCLESAIANHVVKLTVIHGIGNGILRENILNILDDYEGVSVQDAPMQKYGAGAIEIRIPHNL